MVTRLGEYVGADLFRPADQERLIAALEYMEPIRIDLVKIIRAYGHERKRQKRIGRPVPSKAEKQARQTR
jgi:hypothetical protein